MTTKSSKQTRLRGRPPAADNADIRTRLLDVAEERFADQGFAATSIREIGEEASVNPSMVHYYFGSKRDLLIAVLDRSFEPLARAVAELRAADAAPLEAITKLLFEAFGEHPALPRLIVREVMLTSGEMREHFIREYAPRLGAALPPILAREQSAGRLHPDHDPRLLAISLLSLCVFPFVARAVSEPVLGLEYDRAGLHDMRMQVDRLLRGGALA